MQINYFFRNLKNTEEISKQTNYQIKSTQSRKRFPVTLKFEEKSQDNFAPSSDEVTEEAMKISQVEENNKLGDSLDEGLGDISSEVNSPESPNLETEDKIFLSIQNNNVCNDEFGNNLNNQIKMCGIQQRISFETNL